VLVLLFINFCICVCLFAIVTLGSKLNKEPSSTKQSSFKVLDWLTKISKYSLVSNDEYYTISCQCFREHYVVVVPVIFYSILLNINQNLLNRQIKYLYTFAQNIFFSFLIMSL